MYVIAADSLGSVSPARTARIGVSTSNASRTSTSDSGTPAPPAVNRQVTRTY